MIHILCFGDSNAWGYIPGKATRWPDDVRWPGVMARRLGDGYRVIEDCISGRTSVYEDVKLAKRCGIDSLGYSLVANAPIDLAIIALGTNDLKFTDAQGSCAGIRRIIESVRNAEKLYDIKCPLFNDEKRILLIGPTQIRPEIQVNRPDHSLAHAAPESVKLAPLYEQVSKEENVYFLSAADLVYPSPVDCLHISDESHGILGNAVAAKVLEIFEKD